MESIAIKCKSCRSVSVIAGETIEGIVEYRCPCCGLKMSDYQLTAIKIHHYASIWETYRSLVLTVLAELPFEYQMLRENTENGISENRTDQGVIT